MHSSNMELLNSPEGYGFRINSLETSIHRVPHYGTPFIPRCETFCPIRAQVPGVTLVSCATNQVFLQMSHGKRRVETFNIDNLYVHPHQLVSKDF
jgi:hypothetical protein